MENASKYRNLNEKITTNPIIYKWWFRISVIKDLLDNLKEEIVHDKILIHNNYALLYIGSGINGHERLIEYHILDKNNFHQTGVENKRLSSLRQTLCGLLGLNMSTSKEAINKFIDLNCKIEWDTYPKIETKKELEELEKVLIRANYLPLNWQNTTGILTKKHRRILTEMKKKFRK